MGSDSRSVAHAAMIPTDPAIAESVHSKNPSLSKMLMKATASPQPPGAEMLLRMNYIVLPNLGPKMAARLRLPCIYRCIGMESKFYDADQMYSSAKCRQ